MPHLVERLDGVGHAGLQRVVGVYQQRGVGGIDLAVRLKRVIFVVEHLHPRMGHCAACRHAVDLVGDGAGRPGAAADIGRPCADDGRVRALCPA